MKKLLCILLAVVLLGMSLAVGAAGQSLESLRTVTGLEVEWTGEVLLSPGLLGAAFSSRNLTIIAHFDQGAPQTIALGLYHTVDLIIFWTSVRFCSEAGIVTIFCMIHELEASFAFAVNYREVFVDQFYPLPQLTIGEALRATLTPGQAFVAEFVAQENAIHYISADAPNWRVRWMNSAFETLSGSVLEEGETYYIIVWNVGNVAVDYNITIATFEPVPLTLWERLTSFVWRIITFPFWFLCGLFC